MRHLCHRGVLPSRQIVVRSVVSGHKGYMTADGSIYCVGRNYVDHIKELPSLLSIPDELPTSPMIFMKGPGTIVRGAQLLIPKWSSNVQHEVELAVQLGSDLQPSAAAISIDLTARDVQAELKRLGHPWALSKSFKGSCPLGNSFSLDSIDPQQLTISLYVNGAVRQQVDTMKMIFKISEILSYLKYRFPLQPGDWILTGTPEGVAAIKEGDIVTASVSDRKGVILSEGRWKVELDPELGSVDEWRDNVK
ncbi:hypothetical protein CEUSTIGMA_g2603.t1 [Chlamydomonas eustigma]|uniref:Fumarylacetoacetase-like C-terminal domain-containing protein n=1 Tax=Chlamydomonas eustigma TaxID=1157962 RepID=A0A250WWT0_9CHLO|nr:hypothetical protein CEUSTIGMA_g2603.t1 [Chlamydomonas eustigma]|eukprot:GAX75159.1 hypothetical protein CEUSTIGMA_g2603.t1 [Chlamydomonas eustigma]